MVNEVNENTDVSVVNEIGSENPPISKVSELTISDLAYWIKVDAYDKKEFETYLNIAKSFVSNYTGIPITSEDEDAETLDSYADFVWAVATLCQDMYDNRALYMDKSIMNKSVQMILDMHTRNNL